MFSFLAITVKFAILPPALKGLAQEESETMLAMKRFMIAMAICLGCRGAHQHDAGADVLALTPALSGCVRLWCKGRGIRYLDAVSTHGFCYRNRAKCVNFDCLWCPHGHAWQVRDVPLSESSGVLSVQSPSKLDAISSCAVVREFL